MIYRVFPRKTRATPNDTLVGFQKPGLFLHRLLGVDKVHISVTFTWDIPRAEKLAKAWEKIFPTEIGGPAFGKPGEEFIPGRYLKSGYVITSRGCPNRCWFCSVWKREPRLREFPITEGWNLLDDNILACSEGHIRNVFSMLKEQKHKAELTGGLEAKRLLPWHIDLLVDLKPAQMFFAYDTPDDYEPLVQASKILREAGFTRQQMRTYVLIGYRGDSILEAQKRLFQTVELGFYPMAMLWRSENGEKSTEWGRFAKLWDRPASIYHIIKNKGL